jgi:hypothetical protein
MKICSLVIKKRWKFNHKDKGFASSILEKHLKPDIIICDNDDEGQYNPPHSSREYQKVKLLWEHFLQYFIVKDMHN